MFLRSIKGIIKLFDKHLTGKSRKEISLIFCYLDGEINAIVAAFEVI